MNTSTPHRSAFVSIPEDLQAEHKAIVLERLETLFSAKKNGDSFTIRTNGLFADAIRDRLTDGLDPRPEIEITPFTITDPN